MDTDWYALAWAIGWALVAFGLIIGFVVMVSGRNGK